MIGIDTNVLVRFLVEDDLAQTDRVHRFLAKCRMVGETVYVSVIVLCEATWVLGTLYDKPRSQILDALEELLTADTFQVEHEDSVRAALRLPGYVRSRANCRKGAESAPQISRFRSATLFRPARVGSDQVQTSPPEDR